MVATLSIMAMRHFKNGMGEHFGISALTEIRIREDKDSAMRELNLFCYHSPGFDNFSILGSNNNDFQVISAEILLINRAHLSLNKNKKSLLSEFFMVKEHSFNDSNRVI